MVTPVRIAMWSGPRNISTAVMRAFGNRADCAVVDEPFYAAYLFATGLDHPLRQEVIASQPSEWREVVAALTGPVPEGKSIYYQKHMTHHMLPKFGREWIGACVNVFLIRSPEAVLASYAKRRENLYSRRDRPARPGGPFLPRRGSAGPDAAGDRRARRAGKP